MSNNANDLRCVLVQVHIPRYEGPPAPGTVEGRRAFREKLDAHAAPYLLPMTTFLQEQGIDHNPPSGAGTFICRVNRRQLIELQKFVAQNKEQMRLDKGGDEVIANLDDPSKTSAFCQHEADMSSISFSEFVETGQAVCDVQCAKCKKVGTVIVKVADIEW